MGITDPNGNETIAYYDASNRKVAVQDAAGNTTTLDYDENGNLIAQTDPTGKTVVTTYNENDQVQTIKDPKGYVTTRTYDDLGRLYELRDPLTHVTRTIYNAINEKKQVYEAYGTADQAMTSYAYDTNGNLSTITNARSVQFTFNYNDLNQLIKAYDNDGTYREAAYDANGNLVSERKRDGAVINRVYDDLNRLTSVTRDGQTLQTFAYDDLSRMTQAVDLNENRQTHTVAFEYDPLHRLLAEVQDGRRVEREFDPNGNLLRLHYPSGKVVERDYNALNRPISISDNGGGIASLGWDVNNRLSQISPATTNQIGGTITYDERGLETTRQYKTNTDVTLYSMTTLYDANGNIQRETIQGRTSLVKDYTVDNLERLVQEQRDSVVAAVWGYDAVGNWLSTTQNATSETRVANSDNEYTSITGMSPQHDANGNLTSDGTKQYVYDWANRLVEVREGGNQVGRYTYDGLNRRVTKYVNQSSLLTTYVYDGSQIIEELESATLARSYVYGDYLDDPLMVEDAQGTPYFYLKDRQYSVIAIVNAAGQVVERYEYGAFGLMKIYNADGQEITESQVGNIYRYTGRQWDKESGLWYYRNRMYSPTLGRFLQRDPAGYVDGANLYAYVKNNPQVYLDPEGLMARDAYTSVKSSVIDWYNTNFTPIDYPGSSGQPYLPKMNYLSSEAPLVNRALQNGVLAPIYNLAIDAWNTLWHVQSGKASDLEMISAGAMLIPGSRPASIALEYATSKGVSLLGNFGTYVDDLFRSNLDDLASTGGLKLLPAPRDYNQWAGEIRSVVAETDMTMYRVWGDESKQIGGWLTPTKPSSAISAIRDLSLPPGNSAAYVSEVLVPAGTRYQFGNAASAFGQPGGATHVGERGRC